MNDQKELLVTKEGLRKLKEELEKLETEGRQKVAKQINKSASQGDISDSFDYDEAKRAQSFLEGKISEMQDKIRRAKVIEKDTSSEKIQIGSTVKIKLDGEEENLEIVGAVEKDPVNGKISYHSPLGEALLGRKKGEKFKFETPKRKLEVEILEVN